MTFDQSDVSMRSCDNPVAMETPGAVSNMVAIGTTKMWRNWKPELVHIVLLSKMV